MIPKANHHFIVIDVDYAGNKLWTVEGNAGNQYIREMTRRFKYPGDPEAAEKEIYGYYRVVS
jgi:hypothetical protein